MPSEAKLLLSENQVFSLVLFSFLTAIKGKKCALITAHHLLNHQSIPYLSVQGFSKTLDSLFPDLVIYILILCGKKMH